MGRHRKQQVRPQARKKQKRQTGHQTSGDWKGEFIDHKRDFGAGQRVAEELGWRNGPSWRRQSGTMQREGLE